MDPIKNPFSPGAGAPPPELAGRDEVLQQAQILLGRIRQGRPEKSLLLNGLRGVGKTVLLNEIKHIAVRETYRTILVEAHENNCLGLLLAPHLRTHLYELHRLAGAADKVRRGLAVLKSFIGAIKVKVEDYEFGLDIEPEKGTSDSGDLEADLSDLFLAVAEAALSRETGVAILIDEIQCLSKRELSALIMAMHKIQQRGLPLVFIGAGLPVLPGLAGESKTYAERLFNFPDVGALSKEDAMKALQDPVKQYDVLFKESALREIFKLTRGYPYFLQEWGYQAWNQAKTSPITLGFVRNATETVIRRLDSNFFRVRFGRLTPGEKKFLRAMAELGSGPQKTGDVTDLMKTRIHALSPVRASLIKKGMIYSPSHGNIEFTVPLFDEFLLRSIPQMASRNTRRKNKRA